MDYAEISRPYRYREWRNSLAALANRLGISPAGVGYAVKRGEAIAMRTVTSSSNEILTFLRASPNTKGEGGIKSRDKLSGRVRCP
jgi:hypothetical protein